MSIHQDPPLTFTAEELDMLGRTADALSAYMGKPVLAEVIDADETGFEWVLFAIPLETGEDIGEQVAVQVGGAGARIIGNKGGLKITDGDIYQCRYLWAIQLSDIEGVRFIKVDDEGDEVAWSDDLNSMLPFALSDELQQPDEQDDDAENTDDDPDNDLDEGSADEPAGPPPTLH